MFVSIPLVLSLLSSSVLACSSLKSLLSSSQADKELQSICNEMPRMSTCKSCPKTNGKWTCEPYKAYNDLCDEMPDMSQCATWLKSCEGIKAMGGSDTPQGPAPSKPSGIPKPSVSAVAHSHSEHAHHSAPTVTATAAASSSAEPTTITPAAVPTTSTSSTASTQPSKAPAGNGAVTPLQLSTASGLLTGVFFFLVALV